MPPSLECRLDAYSMQIDLASMQMRCRCPPHGHRTFQHLFGFHVVVPIAPYVDNRQATARQMTSHPLHGSPRLEILHTATGDA